VTLGEKLKMSQNVIFFERTFFPLIPTFRSSQASCFTFHPLAFFSIPVFVAFPSKKAKPSQAKPITIRLRPKTRKEEANDRCSIR
jgi:hypothetical protein